METRAAWWAQPPQGVAGLLASLTDAWRRVVQIRIPRCARPRAPGAVQLGLAPRRAALSARHQIGNKTLTGLSASCSVPWTRAPARNGVRAVNSLAPPLPCPDPGRGSHLPLGPASRCRRTSGARPPRALPGVKKKPYRRSARAHSPPALRRTAGGEAGAGAERRGTRGRRGRNQPNSRAWLRRGRGMQAGEQPAGAALPAEWGRRCPSPRASTIVWALGSPLAPPPRLSAPHPTRLPPREKAERAAGAGSERGVTERPRPKSEVDAGERGDACRVGEGTGNCRGGGKAREDWWGEEMGREPRKQERVEWLAGAGL